MTYRQEVQRLLDAIGPILRKHCEEKAGSDLLYIPVTPAEMTKLRSAFVPFNGEAGVDGETQDSKER